ncbi:MAG: S26 family signal peptidase [Candidatus Levybacteria bacterium]|nr:S26 family signal peptidase [Candidatus Levybacteria bacterium]
MLSLFRIRGHSMEPKLKDGSFLIALTIPPLLSKPKVGDTVLFRDGKKKIVKKVKKIENGKYFVEGENFSDSKKYPPIDSEKILGKVIRII